MTEAVYTKLDIAREYLDTAMQLYVEKRNYFAAIHLAATAEELLGKHLPKEERVYTAALKAQIAFQVLDGGREVEYDSAQTSERKRAQEVVVSSKNHIKHMNDDASDPTVTIDPAFEAAHWIEHEPINFEALKLPRLPNYWRFVDYRNTEMRQ
jgi:hypothetical protein